MERENVFHIKNMVCNRCILVVTRLLEKRGSRPSMSDWERSSQEKPGREQREAFRKLLEAYGFELIDDSRMRLIEQIRTAVIELVHYSEDASKVNLSDYLRERCHRDYSALSKLFFGGQRHQHREILPRPADRAGQGTAGLRRPDRQRDRRQTPLFERGHLSAQFRAQTGMSPTEFRRLKGRGLKPLDEV